MWSWNSLLEEGAKIEHAAVASVLSDIRAEVLRLHSGGATGIAERLAGYHNQLVMAVGTIVPAPVAEAVVDVTLPVVEHAANVLLADVETKMEEVLPPEPVDPMAENEPAATEGVSEDGTNAV